jgi:alpha-tubulin suppressor-like RCC1 family protein
MENLASVTSSARILSGASSAHLAISSGKHACAIMKANRGLRCWGSGGLGQLGVNTYYRSVPPQTDVLTDVASVSLGNYHTCALLASGLISCFGYNIIGQLGDGITQSSYVPTWAILSGLGGYASAIGTGADHTCAITLSTTLPLHCWGLGSDGQLGAGDKNDSESALPISTGLIGVLQLSLGHVHTCVVSSDHRVLCWGWGGYGSTGLSTGQATTVPTYIPELYDIARVECGAFVTCSLSLTGDVRCWGDGSSAQLGTGQTYPLYSPSHVIATSVQSISPGGGGGAGSLLGLLFALG